MQTTYEEEYLDHHIYIEPNPDSFSEGFEWAICKDDSEWDNGLEFSIEEALKAAQKAVDLLQGSSN
ncbi:MULTISPECIES: hypothetical protein [Pseudomonadati]|uniref:Phage protein n=1 Tax=Shewanella aestuarii TaxID=1028752 RepID=A0ABT0L5N1_9GAMM|nr:hypothetical protein [Shewanella aestuarii]MCL1118909.1 hypothetical protein [Shewanella aestuarii]GGN84264.1 hypothetical protein GCM10009193_33270 [Shewanella aestuarii]